MADDVLRLRATVVNEEFLANIRVMGRELGLMQTKSGQGFRNSSKEMAGWAAQLRSVGQELRALAPALGGVGLGAAGIGVAAGMLIRTLGDAAKKVVELRESSKELGMSEHDLRAWGNAAQKVGISAESMTQGLSNFKKNTDGLRYNIGNVRAELIQMGAGPLVQRLMGATDQAEKLREAFDFKDTLMKLDPSGYKARAFFDQIGIGADKARLSYDQFAVSQAKLKPISEADRLAAVRYHEALVDLGSQWDTLIIKLGGGIFPNLTRELEDINKVLGLLGDISAWADSWTTNDPMGAFVGWLNRKTGLDKIDPFGWKAEREAKEQAERAGKPPPGAVVAPGTRPPATAPRTSVPSVPGAATFEERFGAGAGATGTMQQQQNRNQFIQRGQQGAPIVIPQSFRQESGDQFGGAQFQRTSFKEVGDDGGSGPMEQFQRAIKAGTFDALVDWTAWVQTGGSSGGGFQKASLTTGAGFGSTGGAGTGTGSAGVGGDPARGGAGVGTGGSGAGTQGGGTGSSPEAGQTGVPRNARMNDEGGKPIDQATMKEAEALGRSGNVAGLQKLFAQKGYRMSGPACGIVASGYVKSAGFKPPPGGAMASQWNDWAQPSSKEDINKEGRPFGSTIASYNERRYGGNVGAPLRKGEKGGHVMTVVPGTFDPKTNTAMFADQYGVRRRSIKNMDIRYAGDEAVQEAQRRRGETPTVAGSGSGRPPGTQVASLGPSGTGGGPAGSGPPGSSLPAQPTGEGGEAYLRQSREKFNQELQNNPELKKRVAALATLENEGDPAVVESLYNRADYTGRSVAQSIGKNSKGKSFYGPVNKNLVEGRLRELERDPERMKRAMAVVDTALSTNLTRGNTDQGSGNDPNIVAGGTGVNRKGGREVPAGTPGAERYNVFGGGPGGHRGAAAYRDRQQAAVAQANRLAAERGAARTAQTGGMQPQAPIPFINNMPSTNRIDQSVAGPRVNATGSVEVNVTSNGTAAKTDASSDGMFQNTTIRQHKQMAETSAPSLAMPVP